MTRITRLNPFRGIGVIRGSVPKYKSIVCLAEIARGWRDDCFLSDRYLRIGEDGGPNVVFADKAYGFDFLLFHFRLWRFPPCFRRQRGGGWGGAAPALIEKRVGGGPVARTRRAG